MAEKIKTLEQIEALEKEMLTPAEVSAVMGMDAHAIRVRAHNADKGGKGLPFPFFVVGARVRIPKRPFVAWMKTGRCG